MKAKVETKVGIAAMKIFFSQNLYHHQIVSIKTSIKNRIRLLDVFGD